MKSYTDVVNENKLANNLLNSELSKEVTVAWNDGDDNKMNDLVDKFYPKIKKNDKKKVMIFFGFK